MNHSQHTSDQHTSDQHGDHGDCSDGPEPKRPHTTRSPRPARWAAIGAAVAVTLGSGGIMSASASLGSGERAVFVPITPCRLMDTRTAPLTVGPRSTPIGAGESYSTAVRGANGNCTIPTDAVGLVMNVAAVNPTAGSFLTVYPSDAPTRPTSANLNWVAGQPPVSNAVTSDISADGKVSFYNLGGTVDLTADIVGYYVDHHHDDRYALKPVGTSTFRMDPAAFRPDGNDPGFYHDFGAGRIQGGATSLCAAGPVTLPQGATVTDVTAHVADGTVGLGNDVVVKLWRNPITVNNATEMFVATTTGAPGDITLTGTTITDPVVDNVDVTYFASVCGIRTLNYLYDLSIRYTNPA